MSDPLNLPTRQEVLNYLNRLGDENHSVHTIFRDVETALLIHSDNPEGAEFQISAALLKVFFDYVESKRG
jgi:hypothetical protein